LAFIERIYYLLIEMKILDSFDIFLDNKNGFIKQDKRNNYDKILKYFNA